MKVLIIAEILGDNNKTFDIYSDIDNFVSPIFTDVTKDELLAGQLVNVPTGTTGVKIVCTSDCDDSLEIPVGKPTTTTTTSTTTVAPTTTSSTTSSTTSTTSTTSSSTTSTSSTSTTSSSTTTSPPTTSTPPTTQSTTCPPSGSLGFFCVGTTKKERFANGACGTYSVIIEENSEYCGFGTTSTTSTTSSTTTESPLDCTLIGTATAI